MLQIHGLGQYVADVNSENKLLTETTGIVKIEAQIHDGVRGVAEYSRALDISQDYRTRVGVDNIAFSDTFSHTVLNYNKYKYYTSTLTTTLANGRMNLNGGGSVAAGYTLIQSTDAFAMYLSYSTYFEAMVACSQLPQAGNELIIGLGLITSNTPNQSVLNQGCYFKITSSGQLVAVVNYNGTEVQEIIPVNDGSDTCFNLSTNMFFHILICMHNDRTEFWIDDACYAAIPTPPAAGSPMQSMYGNIIFRNMNISGTTAAQIMMVQSVLVSTGDLLQVKPWQYIMASSGNGAYQTFDGQTPGYAAYITNSAAPMEITSLSNTAVFNAAYNKKGGDFLITALGGTETDGIIFSYLVPAGTSAIPAKQLIINRIRIDSVNIGATVAGTPTILEWSIAVNGSAASLATADASHATAPTRAHRREVLGIQSWVVGDLDGKQAAVIDITFDTPFVVDNGYYVNIILKILRGTATANQKIRGTCLIIGSQE